MIVVFAYYLFSLKLLLIAIAVLMMASAADDLFVDLCYWVLSLFRRLTGRRNPATPGDVKDLARYPQRPVAIMVPAWQESPVIAQMIESTVKAFAYRHFHLFVGTYPNDPETIREVDRMSRRYPNVHNAVLPHDGGTSKADCLNWIVQRIRLHEEETGTRFAIFVMHDAEDVVHPLELGVFNYALHSVDMAQLPVFSLERRWSEFTAGHYVDEFAEGHTRDLKVREMLTGIVPSAGVATAFSREAIDRLAAANRNVLFNTKSLTEDYDISFRLRALGLTGAFVRFGLYRETDRRSPFTGRWRRVRTQDYVATREYFPDGARAAVRQKARWLLGIGFQGWQIIGWRGTLATKYMLYRDRKAIATSLLGMAAYFIVLNMAVVHAVQWFDTDAYHFPPLVEPGSVLWDILLANLGFLVFRLAHRALFVGRIYGWEQALLSIPRILWSNVINFLACMRALRQFVGHRVTGRPLRWDKTAHVFPSLDELRKPAEPSSIA